MANSDWSVTAVEDDWEPAAESNPITLPTMADSIREEVANAPAWKQLAAGIGTAPMLAGEGLRGLVGQSNPINVADQKALRGANLNTIGGNALGNIGMAYLLPARAIRTTMGGSAPAWSTTRAGAVGDTMLTSGLLAAATEPGSIPERMMAGGTSALFSALFPALTAGVQMVRRVATNPGRQIAVGEALRREAGDKADDLVASLRGRNAPAEAVGAKPSAAIVTKNPALEVLESGSRAKRADLWRGFDSANAKARWDALLERASTEEHLNMLKAARDASTSAMRNKAMDMAEKSIFFEKAGTIPAPELKALTAQIDELMNGAMRPNKDVQTLVSYVRGQLNEGVTPRQLYEVRKYLTDGIKAGPTSELSQAARAARPQRVQIVQQLDDILNKLSGGEYGDYMAAFARESKEITSKEALQKVVTTLQKGQPAGEVPSAMNASWNAVGRLRDAVGTKEFGSKTVDRLLPADRSFLDNLVLNLSDQAGVMKPVATLGSPTASLLANVGRAEATTRFLSNGASMLPIPAGGILASKVFDEAGNKAEQQLAYLLQNPEQLARALEKAKSAEKVLRASTKVGQASGAASR